MIYERMKIKVAVIMLLCFLLIPTAALANAGPVYLEEYPGLGIAAMDDCPVRVVREELTFVIDERSASSAVVTANYTLHNTAPELISVPMIFPFVSHGYGGGDAQIEFNGKVVDYEIFMAGSVDIRDYLEDPAAFKKQIDMNTIINNLNKPFYEPQFFDDQGDAVLYEVIFNAPAERQNRISFNVDPERTRVISFGFMGFGIGAGGECILSTYVRNNDLGKKGYILVLGDDTVKDVRADYDDEVVKSVVNVRDFLLDFLQGDGYTWLNMERRNMDNFYSMFVKEIDQSFTRYQPVKSESMIMENLFSQNNISALLYEVEFEADSQNELRLTYPMRATLDRRETRDYINTFAYILNPARNFMEFGGLDLRIELNDSYPYIIESSLPLEEAGRGIYTLSLDSLPDEDLVFSTYPKEEITLLDSTMAQVFPHGYGGLYAGFVAVLLLISIASAAAVVIVKKRTGNL